ncbi:Uncharacterised protein [Neisseria gonorrhoeae]|uniref:Uncharacterized protein n=1 Tax=Neisseria gonorrhoeae TaxID=485 RepID=A0A378W077_NEIGO|nr:Uncharacterised protein [Neisseria gonorrhoeae]
MDGDGLVDARAECVQCGSHFDKGGKVGVQRLTAHALCECVRLAVECGEFFLRGKSVAADCLDTHDKCLIADARDGFGNLEMVVHGAADNLVAAAVGKARQCVQFFGFGQRDIGDEVEAHVKPGQFDLRQLFERNQRFCRRLRNGNGFCRRVGRFRCGMSGLGFGNGVGGVADNADFFQGGFDFGFERGGFCLFLLGDVDGILFLQVAHGGVLGFGRFLTAGWGFGIMTGPPDGLPSRTWLVCC